MPDTRHHSQAPFNPIILNARKMRGKLTKARFDLLVEHEYGMIVRDCSIILQGETLKLRFPGVPMIDATGNVVRNNRGAFVYTKVFSINPEERFLAFEREVLSAARKLGII
jgi:hypothetical protein